MFEVTLREEAFLVGDAGPEFLDVLISPCASEGEIVIHHLCVLIREVNSSLETCVARPRLVVLVVIILPAGLLRVH